ncbi:polysaccharide biosynthesis C-terminal domain-containing protein [Urechidicola vernalis]|uniref:Polysaccharide biosynthesis protein C-terminal domain-containing protein n=1 Tax=Urechidicola vernalis TaxID=3075600 RepID=A0ABU2Y802_9FLAO|nr:polysaccharide biosynthesis C-terminal domain-containing protein [Urechidicola sp. P050]MDT0554157.1 hypothetical protein [Urechidicola sp. P050]
MKESIESLITRGVSIGLKFLLLGFLARNMSLNDFGAFQLISYFVLIGITLFGFEYYNKSNREIAKGLDSNKIYQKHIRFFFTISPILLGSYILFYILILPKELISLKNIIIVFIIIICDYISQEIYRYLMISKKFRLGNIQLIYKSSIFLILCILLSLYSSPINFDSLLAIMLISYICLLLLAYLTFSSKLYSVSKEDFRFLKGQEVFSEIKKLWPFIVLIAFVKGIEFSDKFILGKFLSLEEVGVYSFIFSMAFVINVFVLSGFYIIYLPQLIEAYESNFNLFKKLILKFGLLNFLSSLVMGLMIILLSESIFMLINKPELIIHTNLLIYIIIGFIFCNMSLIGHIYLYIVHDEKFITLTMGLALFTNIILNFYLIDIYGLMGASISFCITYVIVLIFKSLRAILLWKRKVVY